MLYDLNLGRFPQSNFLGRDRHSILLGSLEIGNVVIETDQATEYFIINGGTPICIDNIDHLIQALTLVSKIHDEKG